MHAYRLGQTSGLSFGFWGARANRYSWIDLITPRYWADLLLRVAVHNFAVIGVPLLAAGITAPSNAHAQWPGEPGSPTARHILLGGMVAVFAAGTLASGSSAVHEYYQLPLMLFACPYSWGGLPALATLLSFWMLISLTILSLDYWQAELPLRQPVWHSAGMIRLIYTRKNQRIVPVIDSDPTLLYLAHQKGWLTSRRKVSEERLSTWRQAGASHTPAAGTSPRASLRSARTKSNELNACSVQREWLQQAAGMATGAS